MCSILSLNTLEQTKPNYSKAVLKKASVHKFLCKQRQIILVKYGASDRELNNTESIRILYNICYTYIILR